jgi:hypothetical protein
MVHVLGGISSASSSVLEFIVLVLQDSLTVVGTWSYPRFGFPGLAGLDISIGREGQS